MRQSLFIHLRSPDGTDSYPYRVDGAATGATRVDSLARIAEAAPGARIIVIVPATHVRLMDVALPVRSRARARAAAPFACEDRLAEDIEALHFAHLARIDDDAHAFAVVSHQRMRDWLSELRDAGLHPSLVIPENLCLPVPEAGSWTVAQDTALDLVLVRQGAYSGTVLQVETLATWIEMSGDEAPQALHVLQRGNPALPPLPEGVSVSTEPLFGSLLDLFVSQIDEHGDASLLQGDYAPESNVARHLRPWRAAAVFALVALTLAFSAQVMETRRIHQLAATQQAENLERFNELFPGYRDDVRAEQLPSFVGSEIRRMEGGGERATLLALLDSYAQASSSTGGLELRGMQWRDRALLLNLRGETLEHLEALRQWYENEARVQLEVETANASSEGVQIRVRLRLA